MNILFLSPQPFYQDRGTPIAVHMVLQALSHRGNRVDVVTYPEGREMVYEHVTIHRAPKLPLIKGIRPGFSWAKIVYDLFMLFQAFSLVTKRKYHLIHAVEEAVFIALLIKFFFNIPYVYDMDSSLPQQLIEKCPYLSIVLTLINFFEGLAVKNAKVTVPVCLTLANDVRVKYGSTKIVLLPDVTLV